MAGLACREGNLLPAPGLKGHEIMIAFEQFLNDNPGISDKPYGDAMASTLSVSRPSPMSGRDMRR